jgi:ribosomal protein S3
MNIKRKMKIITTKEAKIVLGKSMRQTRRLMNKVRDHYGKEPHQPINVDEFCRFFNYDIEDIYALLEWDKK